MQGKHRDIDVENVLMDMSRGEGEGEGGVNGEIRIDICMLPCVN